MTDEMGKTVTDGLAEVDKCASACEHFADRAASYLAREPVAIEGAEGVRHLQPARRRARGHALELSVLAGLPLRRTGADGGQRRRSQARQQRARAARWRSSRCFATPAFPRACSPPCWCRAPESSALIEDRARRRGHADRQRRRRPQRRRRRRRGAEEVRARARRRRRLPGARGCRPRAPRPRSAPPPAWSTPARAASPASASSSFARLRAAFEEAMVEAMRAYELGDPRDPATRLGPLQSVAARDQIHAQVEASVRAGARLLLGGVVPRSQGRGTRRRCSRTSAAGSRRTTRKCSGRSPRSSKRADERDAIAIANASEFGLGSGVLTQRPGARRAHRRRGARRRPDLRQRQRPLRPAHAVRRRQAFGLRPRVRRLRHPRVRQHQVGARQGLGPGCAACGDTDSHEARRPALRRNACRRSARAPGTRRRPGPASGGDRRAAARHRPRPDADRHRRDVRRRPLRIAGRRGDRRPARRGLRRQQGLPAQRFAAGDAPFLQRQPAPAGHRDDRSLPAALGGRAPLAETVRRSRRCNARARSAAGA